MKESSVECRKPDVLVSKKIIAWKLFQFLVFIACVTGFTIQAKNFFTHFYTYPTVINTEVRILDEFIEPAITFCYTSQFKRSKYCDTYPDHCSQPKNVTAFCEKNWYYCRNDTNLKDFKIPKQEYLEYENYVNRNNTEQLCQEVSPFVHTRGKNGGQLLFIQTRPKYGLTRFLTYPCFSKNIRLESQLPPNIKKLEKRTSVSLYRFTIDAGQDEMFDPSARPGILFALHSPFVPSNPYVKGTLMKPGRSYQVHISLEEEHLLEHPYKTDCVDYNKIWEANNRTGPRSREMCIDLCQIEYSLGCRQCEWGLSMYKGQQNMCEMNNGIECTIRRDRTKDIQSRKDCMNNCKKECVRLFYLFTVEERTNIPTVDDEEGKGYIDVDIFVDEPEVLVLSHKPQYMDVEAFSYIGGFMGCWLGISIWAFAHNIGSIVSCAVAYVKNCCGRKTGRKSALPAYM